MGVKMIRSMFVVVAAACASATVDRLMDGVLLCIAFVLVVLAIP